MPCWKQQDTKGHGGGGGVGVAGLLGTVVRDAGESLATATWCKHGSCQYNEQACGGETRGKKKQTSLCPMNREAVVEGNSLMSM